MIEYHRLPPAQLAALASGVHSPAAIETLRAGQLSRHLLLIRHVADAAPSRDALAVIDAARARDPDGARDVLSDPMVGAWLARTVQDLRVRPARADLGQLPALAAATAIRAGLDADLTMDVRGPDIMVPTMGSLLGAGVHNRAIKLRVRAGRLALTDGASTIHVPAEGGRWRALRRLSSDASPPGALTLDDTSSCRDIFQTPPQSRLCDDEVERWHSLVVDASALLSHHAADRMAESNQVLRTLVPLRTTEAGISQSATARHAFGAVGATMPPSSADLAITFVHEVQHSKLNAILQLEPLFDATDPTAYFAPWRRDPRPIWGLFHGVYAFLAVAELLSRLRAEPAQERQAEKKFAELRLQLRAALESLAGATSLTNGGRGFVSLMWDRLEHLEDVRVSPPALDSAVRSFNQSRVWWKQRNGPAV